MPFVLVRGYRSAHRSAASKSSRSTPSSLRAEFPSNRPERCQTEIPTPGTAASSADSAVQRYAAESILRGRELHPAGREGYACHSSVIILTNDSYDSCWLFRRKRES